MGRTAQHWKAFLRRRDWPARSSLASGDWRSWETGPSGMSPWSARADSPSIGWRPKTCKTCGRKGPTLAMRSSCSGRRAGAGRSRKSQWVLPMSPGMGGVRSRKFERHIRPIGLIFGGSACGLTCVLGDCQVGKVRAECRLWVIRGHHGGDGFGPLRVLGEGPLFPDEAQDAAKLRIESPHPTAIGTLNTELTCCTPIISDVLLRLRIEAALPSRHSSRSRPRARAATLAPYRSQATAGASSRSPSPLSRFSRSGRPCGQRSISATGQRSCLRYQRRDFERACS